MKLKPTISIKEDRKLYDEIMTQIALFENSHVEIGTLSGTRRKDGSNMAVIAATHEYGSEKKKIPSRSFLRAFMDEKRDKINTKILNMARAITAGKLMTKKGLTRLGVWGAGQVKKKITDVDSPPLKKTTIKRRKWGGTNPLIDTGQLRSTQKSKVIMRGAGVLARIIKRFSKMGKVKTR